MQDKNLVVMKALEIKFQGGPVPLVHPLDPPLVLIILEILQNVYTEIFTYIFLNNPSISIRCNCFQISYKSCTCRSLQGSLDSTHELCYGVQVVATHRRLKTRYSVSVYRTHHLLFCMPLPLFIRRAWELVNLFVGTKNFSYNIC